MSKQRKRKIGLLGGSFNPPHLGHLWIAEECRQQHKLEEVWFIPAGDPPHKRNKPVSGQHRVAMLRALLRGHPQLKIDRSELKREGPSYTYDTVTQLQEKHPDCKFYFIVGADMIRHFSKWYRLAALSETVEFLLVPRPGSTLPDVKACKPFFSAAGWKRLQKNVTLIPQMDLASSDIRQRIKRGHSIRHMTGVAVANYIKKPGLYQ